MRLTAETCPSLPPRAPAATQSMPDTKLVALCPHPVLPHACVDSAEAATPNTSEQQNKTGSSLQVGLALSGLTLSFVPHLMCPGFRKSLQLETCCVGCHLLSPACVSLSLLSLSSPSLMHPLLLVFFLSSPTNENPHLSAPRLCPSWPRCLCADTTSSPALAVLPPLC